MSTTLALWLVILAVGLSNYLSRLSFIALFARWNMPALVARALRFVPAAMLTAIVVPAVVLQHADGLAPGLAAAKPVAAVVALLVAWRTRSTAATMIVGMLALWSMQWLFRAPA
jgi:branched-subunit amino acid transport protein